MPSSSPSPLKPDVFHILLALDDEPRHGYALLKEVEAATGGGLRIAPSLLYRKLRRLLEEGLVEETGLDDGPEADDERRRYYRLTARGKQILKAEASRLVSLAGSKRVRRLAKQAGRNV